MNKYRLRSFSFGIIFAVSIVSIFHFFFNEEKEELITTKEPSIEEAKDIVLKNNLLVLTEDEYKDLEAAKEELKKLQAEQKKDKSKKTAQKDEKKVKKFTLEVKTGMTSNDIAMILKREKIIKDENDFIDYLALNDYSRSIQLGSFKLTDEMSYKKIAETITK